MRKKHTRFCLAFFEKNIGKFAEDFAEVSRKLWHPFLAARAQWAFQTILYDFFGCVFFVVAQALVQPVLRHPAQEAQPLRVRVQRFFSDFMGFKPRDVQMGSQKNQKNQRFFNDSMGLKPQDLQMDAHRNQENHCFFQLFYGAQASGLTNGFA